MGMIFLQRRPGLFLTLLSIVCSRPPPIPSPGRLVAKVAEGDAVEAIVEAAEKWDLRGRSKEKEYLASEEADADEEDGEDVVAEARARAISEGLDTFWYACDVLWKAAEESAKVREKCEEALKVRGGGWSWLKEGKKEMGGDGEDGA